MGDDRLWKGRLSFDRTKQRFRTMIDGLSLESGVDPTIFSAKLIFALTDDDWGDAAEALMALNSTTVYVKDFGHGELWVRPENFVGPVEMPDYLQGHEGRFFVGRFLT